jgi:hypothetical protein
MALRSDAQVARLQVAVNNSLCMCSFQPLHQLNGQINNIAIRQGPSFNPVAQCLAGHVLHDEEIAIVRGFEVVNRRNVRMIKPRESQRFAAKASSSLLIRQQVW